MSSEWRETITGLLDGVETQLCQSAPQYARATLAGFRDRVAVAKSKAARKRLERELESCLDSKAFYRGAARRHLNSELKAVIPGLERLLELAEEHKRRYAADRKLEATRDI